MTRSDNFNLANYDSVVLLKPNDPGALYGLDLNLAGLLQKNGLSIISESDAEARTPEQRKRILNARMWLQGIGRRVDLSVQFEDFDSHVTLASATGYKNGYVTYVNVREEAFEGLTDALKPLLEQRHAAQ